MSYTYSKYLNDLAALWQGWSQSRYMRKYLYMSLGLVIAFGVVIGVVITYTLNGLLSPIGIPVAFLLISGYDWLKRRKSYRPTPKHTGYGEGWQNVQTSVEDNLEDTTELHLDDEESEEEFDEHYEDLFGSECDCGHDHDVQGSVDHMPDDDTHN